MANPLERLRRSAAGAAAGPGGGGRGLTLLAVALGWLLVLGLRYLIPALLPQIKAEFGIDNATAGLAVTVVWGTYGLAQFPAGVLVDRVGERKLLAGSLAAAAVSLVALGLSPAFLGFLVGCTVFGVGTGLYGPARGTVLSRTFSDKQGAAFGATLAAGSVGSAAFPFLSGLLVETLGWRTITVLAIPLLLAVATLLWRSVPPGVTGDGAGLSLAGVRTDLLPAVNRRSVAVSTVAVTLMLFGFQGLTAFLPTYLIEVKGFDQRTAASLFALMFLGGAAFQLVGGNAADRYGDRAVLVALAAAGVLVLAAIPLLSGALALAVLLVLLGSRMAIAPVSNAYIIGVLPSEVQGSAWGLVRTGFFLFGATGSMFVGVFADADLFDEAFYVLAGVTAVATALYWLLPERER